MIPTRESHRVASPTPDAYDGAWLEMLENPDGERDPSADADGPISDAWPDPGLTARNSPD
jgi:hypothetical protein